MNEKKVKILIGSNGGLTGVYLAKRLRKEYFLYGFDSDCNTVGKFFVDRQVYLPGCQSPEFLEKLIEVLNKEQIDVYLPTYSKEMRIIAENAEKIKKSSAAKFLVSPLETFQALENKVLAGRNLKGAGFFVPEQIYGTGCEYPIFMKKDIGSGSNGTILIENAEIHKAFMDTYDTVSFYEYIEGDEYTVDCIFDVNGRLLGYNQRKRIKTIGGAVRITENAGEMEILPWLEKLSERWKFCGCVNFQYILRDSRPYFIDINLRYPSGGLPLTVESGLDIPQMTVKILLGEKISRQEMEYKDIRRMYRYFEEIFE